MIPVEVWPILEQRFTETIKEYISVIPRLKLVRLTWRSAIYGAIIAYSLTPQRLCPVAIQIFLDRAGQNAPQYKCGSRVIQFWPNGRRNLKQTFSFFQRLWSKNHTLLDCRDQLVEEIFGKYSSGHLQQLPWLIGKLFTFLKNIRNTWNASQSSNSFQHAGLFREKMKSLQLRKFSAIFLVSSFLTYWQARYEYMKMIIYNYPLFGTSRSNSPDRDMVKRIFIEKIGTHHTSNSKKLEGERIYCAESKSIRA